MNMPDIWANGAVFGSAFRADCGIHGRLCNNKIAVCFGTDDKCTLNVDLADIRDFGCNTVLTDCVEMWADDGLNRYDISMISPCANGVLIHCNREVDVTLSFDGNCDVTGDLYNCGGKCYALKKKELSSGVVYAFATGADCGQQAEAMCNADFERELGKIKNRYAAHNLPKKLPDAYRALCMRCMSIIEHNISSKGCFGKVISGKLEIDVLKALMCALALKNVYPQYALTTVVRIADYISDDGFLPSVITGGSEANAAPPFVCWCFEQIAGNNRALAEKYYDKLRSSIMYFVQNRDINNNNLFQWFCGERNNPGVESGMLNSPRFDGKVIVSAIDLSAYMYMAATAMGKLSRLINRNSDVLYWGVLAQRIADSANNFLYSKERRFYFDRGVINNRFVDVMTTAGFMPLYAGFAPREYCKTAVAMLCDKALFGGNRGVPAVARSESAYSADMYRGSVMLSENYKIICSLMQCEQSDVANAVASACLEAVRRGYESDGIIYESYSPQASVAHRRQHRLGSSISPMCVKNFEHAADCPVTAAMTVGIMDMLTK